MLNVIYSGVRFVVARYKENMDWIQPLLGEFPGSKCFVYNKNNTNDSSLPEGLSGLSGLPGVTVQRLPNVGRESHTYLTHLIDTDYARLSPPGFVCCVFLQGHPFDHVAGGTFAHLVQAVRHAIMRIAVIGSKFENIGTRLIPIRNFETTFHPGLKSELRATFHDIFGANNEAVDEPNTIVFSAGAMFAVSGEALRTRSSEFYSNMIAWVDKDKDPVRGYCLERLWSPIFTRHTRL